MTRDRSDPLIDTLIKPPRYVYATADESLQVRSARQRAKVERAKRRLVQRTQTLKSIDGERLRRVK